MAAPGLPPSKPRLADGPRVMYSEKKAPPQEVSDADVLAHLVQVRQPASLREIAHALGLHHRGLRALPKILARLTRKGEVEEARAGR